MTAVTAVTSEYAEIADAARSLLGARSPMSAVRAGLPDRTGYDRDLWQAVTEMGLVGLAVPERFGGGGAGISALGGVLEQMGRSLPRIPFFATAGLAVPALLAAGGPAAEDLLTRICTGGLTASLATVEPHRGWIAADIASRADRHAGGYRLSGTKAYVVDGAAVAVLLVSALLDGSPRLFAVTREAAGVTPEPVDALDLTRPLARVSFHDADAVLLGDPDTARDALGSALLTSRLALAFEQVGGALRCVEMAVGYARVRDQFGRKIGSFQAIKHLCADMYAAAQMAQATANHAATTIDAAARFVPRASNLAKIVASESFSFVAAQNIQVHGGMGFTWEHDAHLFFRRARWSALYLGSPAECKRELGAQLEV
jgi:alkylation response protein AidB-like acyl-CoA dehydrogenase